MSEARVFADGFWKSFAGEGELMKFLRERTGESGWIRRPTKELRLIPMENEKARQVCAAKAGTEEILTDTEKHTQMLLKVKKEYYPVRDCAIHSILKRARIQGNALKCLSNKDYARIVNLCLQTAKGLALIRLADGKVSAVHGGGDSDYKILDTEQIFAETLSYLYSKFPGTKYIPESGSYDHTSVTAMWELTGKPEFLESYQEALKRYGIKRKVHAPALRLATSDVAEKSVTLHQMLLCENHAQAINLGSPIRLAHIGDADMTAFRKNLNLISLRYQEAVQNLERLLEIPVYHPVNCIMGVIKKLEIPKKYGSKVLELYLSQNGEGATNAHEIYYALHEAVFFAACDGKHSGQLLELEEKIMRAVKLDWEAYDLAGTVAW